MATIHDTIRDALPIAGKRIMDVTCDDGEEIVAKFPNPEDRISRVYIHLGDGATFSFHVTEDMGFYYDGYEDDGAKI